MPWNSNKIAHLAGVIDVIAKEVTVLELSTRVKIDMTVSQRTIEYLAQYGDIVWKQGNRGLSGHHAYAYVFLPRGLFDLVSEHLVITRLLARSL